MEEYAMPDIISTIHALGEAQKEITSSVKELKNLIPKPSKKISGKNLVQAGCTRHFENSIRLICSFGQPFLSSKRMKLGVS